MKINKIVITGEEYFLQRYKFLFTAMSPYFNHLDFIPFAKTHPLKFIPKLLSFYTNYMLLGKNITSFAKFSIVRLVNFYNKNSFTFIKKSKQTENKIRELENVPDLIFHVFSLYCPLWNQVDIPYVMYLDYTMALAKKNWPSWVPYINQSEYESWIACESEAYKRAYHLFSMSNSVKSSLIEDYGIAAHKITVVGSSGNFFEPYEGEKLFGSKQIIFNGSDFQRKGGDLVVAAFKKVKEALPEAKLIIIGKKVSISGAGIDNPGKISSRLDMRELFLKSDLVVAPGYCDPFPAFLMEAMNYGVPCIVSDNDGMPEIVDNEVNGIVIHQPTSELLAQYIIKLLQDISRLEIMSHNARYKIKNKLNWNNIAKNIIQVLSNQVDKGESTISSE